MQYYMNDEIYKIKYLKYKNKYLNLKNKLEQIQMEQNYKIYTFNKKVDIKQNEYKKFVNQKSKLAHNKDLERSKELQKQNKCKKQNEYKKILNQKLKLENYKKSKHTKIPEKSEISKNLQMKIMSGNKYYNKITNYKSN